MAKKAKGESVQVELTGKLDVQVMLAENSKKYLMVNLLARRARALNDGHRRLVEQEGPHTVLDTAIAEGREGLLKVVKKEEPKVIVDLVENS